jgi:hypothetical protein
MTPEDYIMANTFMCPMSGCWIWSGAWNGAGYGVAWFDKKRIGAHRAAWMTLVGEIPAGLELDHLCRNRACVNPAHLRVCTHRDNVLAAGSLVPSALHAAKEKCPRCGGEFAVVAWKKSQRVCRQCVRKSNHARYHGKKAQVKA